MLFTYLLEIIKRKKHILKMLKKINFIKNGLVIFICFYVINLILSYFLFVDNYILNNTSYSYEQLEIIQLLIILILLYYFNKKIDGGIKIKKTDVKLYPFLVLVLISVILFRISIDPIIWIDKTLHFIEVPVNNDYPNDNDFIENTLIFFSTVVLTPIVEETMFRGIIIKSLNNLEIKYKILISSIFFSLMHLPIDINSLIIIFFLGIILGIITIKLGLIFAIIFHFIYNLIWYLLNINPKYYWQVVSILEFNYIYWISILIALFGLLLILKKMWINKNSY